MVTFRETASRISSERRQRYLKALRVLKKVADILIKKYHVSKIILVGSLVNQRRFGFHSDIDLCVEGLSDKLYFQAVGELLLAADEFDIDVIPMESLPQNRKESIEKGKVIYEKL
jgi:predicted nucleotidyltransferase